MQGDLIFAKTPFRFRGQTLESFRVETPAQQKVLDTVRDYVHRFPEHYAAGRCLTFCGNTGTGKTLLANGIVQSLLDTEFLTHKEHPQPSFLHTAHYATATEIIRRVRDARKAQTRTAEVIEYFGRVDLLVIDEIEQGLVIDDIEAQLGIDSGRALLHEVLDLRYRAVRPTVVISSCSSAELTHALGEWVVDRLRDHGGLFCEFTWGSWRKYGKAREAMDDPDETNRATNASFMEKDEGGSETWPGTGVLARRYRVADALAKAMVDPFEYAMGLRDGTIFIFTEASEPKNGYLHISNSTSSVPEHFCNKYKFGSNSRGVDVRLSEIMWIADAPNGS